MKNWNGSIRSSTINAPTNAIASGRWSTNELIQAKSSSTWPTLTAPTTTAIEYLVIAGGGGGGTNGGGGGGAGGYKTASDFSVNTNTLYTITVGSGGAGAINGSSRGTNGSNSAIALTNSYSFNGSTQYLSVAANTALDLGSSNFTIEMWAYFTGSSDFTLFQKASSYELKTDANRWVYQVNAASNSFVTSGTLTANTWVHVALVRNGATTTLYLNGTSYASGPSIDANTNSNPLKIASGGSANFNGYITNFRIVKGTAVYIGNFTVPTSPLTVTQSAGTFINAVTGTQTSLLTLQNATIIDNSTYALAITNNNGVALITNTTPFTITSIGGGGGASRDGGGSGANGGSGGGGADGNIPAGTGIAGQGNNGGVGGSNTGAGGGGGAGAVGGAVGTGSGGNSGNGGIGIQWPTGSGTYYAGGGGGQRCPGLGSGGASGGLGGGGTGAGGASAAGTANTGGGAGGDGGEGNTRTGGSGVVIIRYANIYAAAASTTGSPTVTDAGGYRVYKYTSSGSITF